MSTLSVTVAESAVLDFSDDESEAGPSMTFAQRQAETMNKLSMEFQCTICTDRFPRAMMVTTKCSHRYCGDCAKSLFMRAIKDEQLYPPRCCKQPIPLNLVTRHMNAEEIYAFELASVEYSTRKRTYCSNRNCNVFIHPSEVEPDTGRVVCKECVTATCSRCNNGYHYNTACPDDEALRETQALAQAMGWKSCNNCDRMIQLRTGCNHITCKCSAEFCYVCGIEWKNCSCAVADLHLIEERAEEVVNRDAPHDLPRAEWQQRVDHVFNELRDRHECEHSRRFERKTYGQPKKGFRCELCSHRHWKYILQCRLCYLNVCEDCRRNRI
ncbi:ariadne RING finger [Lizonia empirigonia]|nr:ariadne RING finger [Lizonia empirigonia]